MFDLSVTAPIIALLFQDKMDVYRYNNSSNDDHTTDTERSSVPDISNVSCKISFDYETVEKPLDDAISGTAVKSNIKIFCANSVALRAGDFVVARRLAADGTTLFEYEGIIGMPSVFPTHLEVLLGVKENA